MNGAANWMVGGTPSDGAHSGHLRRSGREPVADFLGINVVDCLLCHDGARHLDAINLWGAQQKRSDMWGLAAFFARTQMQTGGRVSEIRCSRNSSFPICAQASIF